jgi:hypothetical protein
MLEAILIKISSRYSIACFDTNTRKQFSSQRNLSRLNRINHLTRVMFEVRLYLMPVRFEKDGISKVRCKDKHGNAGSKIDLVKGRGLESTLTFRDPADEHEIPPYGSRSRAECEACVDIETRSQHAPTAPKARNDNPFGNRHHVCRIEQNSNRKWPDEALFFQMHAFHCSGSYALASVRLVGQLSWDCFGRELPNAEY